MKGNWNIDKSYKNINMDIYVGNYIGFKDKINNLTNTLKSAIDKNNEINKQYELNEQ